jgi:hypothetical protein
MGTSGESAMALQSHEPILPVWRMFCQCAFRAGRRGEIAACGCGAWWRVGARGRWHAISRRRAFRSLLPHLRRELGHFEMSGEWPAH